MRCHWHSRSLSDRLSCSHTHTHIYLFTHNTLLFSITDTIFIFTDAKDDPTLSYALFLLSWTLSLCLTCSLSHRYIVVHTHYSFLFLFSQRELRYLQSHIKQNYKRIVSTWKEWDEIMQISRCPRALIFSHICVIGTTVITYSFAKAGCTRFTM